MKIAIPICEDGISPVFDVAKHLLMVDVEGTQVIATCHVSLEKSNPDRSTQQVIDLGTDTLICGAISSPLESFLLSAGVNVISKTCGVVEDVLHAFVTGKLDEGLFVMPGCHGRRQPRRQRRCNKGTP
jgi:predicted Fe-Mo cluster-binding NifX family protein